jgi:hypothetical protein
MVELIYLRSVLINFTCYGHIEGLFAALQLLGIEVLQNKQESIVKQRNDDFDLNRSRLLTVIQKDLIPPQCVTKGKFAFLQNKFYSPMNSNLYLPSAVQMNLVRLLTRESIVILRMVGVVVIMTMGN